MRWVLWTRGHGARERNGGRQSRKRRSTRVLFLVLFSLLLAAGSFGASGQLAGAVTVAPVATGGPNTSGCTHAPPVAPGVSGMRRLRVGSQWRTYLLHVPTTYRRSQPQPLVLLFHGHGSNASHFEQVTRFSALADQRDVIVVYPQGAVGQDGQTGWDTHRGRDPTTNDVAFVSALLAALRGQVCVDTRRIYAAGFSNGGGMTAELACALPEPFAAIAVVSGDFYPQPGGCHPSRPLAIIEIHGTADKINPYDGSSHLSYPSVAAWVTNWVARNGCVGAPLTTITGLTVSLDWATCRAGAEVLHVRLIGGSHVWPGGIMPASAPAVDRAYDATGAIWAFFAAHALPGTVTAR